MPRLSLYKPERGKDYSFIDDRIFEMFTVGGTDVNVHMLLGSPNPTDEDASATLPQYDEMSVTNIQDLLFLENRDRKYEQDIYTIRGIYNLQDLEFNLSQFGMFLNNDLLLLTIHMNSTVKTLGRKIVIGDVIELPHLRDEYALNDYQYALKNFYVVEDVTRPAEGYSPTWFPHLYRLKLKQIADGQEFKDIDGKESTRDKEMAINDAIVADAEANALLSGYETQHFFTLQVDDSGQPELIRADTTSIDASTVKLHGSIDHVMRHPVREGYLGHLLGDGIPPNGLPFGCGITFPTTGIDGDYWLRTDMIPNRLFRYDGKRWIKFEDNVRMTLTPREDRYTQKGTFINNTTSTEICGEDIPERQGLSKALRPKVDIPHLDNPEECDSNTPGRRS